MLVRLKPKRFRNLRIRKTEVEVDDLVIERVYALLSPFYRREFRNPLIFALAGYLRKIGVSYESALAMVRRFAEDPAVYFDWYWIVKKTYRKSGLDIVFLAGKAYIRKIVSEAIKKYKRLRNYSAREVVLRLDRIFFPEKDVNKNVEKYLSKFINNKDIKIIPVVGDINTFAYSDDKKLEFYYIDKKVDLIPKDLDEFRGYTKRRRRLYPSIFRVVVNKGLYNFKKEEYLVGYLVRDKDFRFKRLVFPRKKLKRDLFENIAVVIDEAWAVNDYEVALYNVGSETFSGFLEKYKERTDSSKEEMKEFLKYIKFRILSDEKYYDAADCYIFRKGYFSTVVRNGRPRKEFGEREYSSVLYKIDDFLMRNVKSQSEIEDYFYKMKNKLNLEYFDRKIKERGRVYRYNILEKYNISKLREAIHSLAFFDRLFRHKRDSFSEFVLYSLISPYGYAMAQYRGERVVPHLILRDVSDLEAEWLHKIFLNLTGSRNRKIKNLNGCSIAEVAELLDRDTFSEFVKLDSRKNHKILKFLNEETSKLSSFVYNEKVDKTNERFYLKSLIVLNESDATTLSFEGKASKRLKFRRCRGVLRFVPRIKENEEEAYKHLENLKYLFKAFEKVFFDNYNVVVNMLDKFETDKVYLIISHFLFNELQMKAFGRILYDFLNRALKVDNGSYMYEVSGFEELRYVAANAVFRDKNLFSIVRGNPYYYDKIVRNCSMLRRYFENYKLREIDQELFGDSYNLPLYRHVEAYKHLADELISAQIDERYLDRSITLDDLFHNFLKYYFSNGYNFIIPKHRAKFLKKGLALLYTIKKVFSKLKLKRYYKLIKTKFYRSRRVVFETAKDVFALSIIPHPLESFPQYYKYVTDSS